MSFCVYTVWISQAFFFTSNDCYLAKNIYFQNFTGKKCALLEDLKECKDKIEINLPSSFLIRDNKEFTQILKSNDASQAIQLKPQSFDVQLKPGNYFWHPIIDPTKSLYYFIYTRDRSSFLLQNQTTKRVQQYEL